MSAHACITGVGQSRIAKALRGCTNLGIIVDGSAKALGEAGLSPHDVDGVITHGETSRPNWAHDNLDLAAALGIDELAFTTCVAMGGATPSFCIELARQAVESGRCSHVLVAGGGKLSDYGGAPSSVGGAAGNYMSELPHHSATYEQPFGTTIPVFYAAMAQRFMHEYGTTPEQLALVAVNARANAAANPEAWLRQPVTIEDVLASRFIATPLHLLECAVPNDGAAAIVVSSADRARDLPMTPVMILGTGYAQSYYYTGKLSAGGAGFDLVHTVGAAAAKMAMDEAGIDPADVDVAELYDSFSITVLAQLEDMGFCDRGGAGAFVEAGGIEIDGRLPVNTHGGHMGGVGFSGFGHPIEAVRQLRGECGSRQVPNAHVAFVSSVASVASTYSTAVLATE